MTQGIDVYFSTYSFTIFSNLVSLLMKALIIYNLREYIHPILFEGVCYLKVANMRANILKTFIFNILIHRI